MEHCPFCGSRAKYNNIFKKYSCSNKKCELYNIFFTDTKWNNRIKKNSNTVFY